MNSNEYYQKNANFNKRKLKEGISDERNAHNFIKSTLIKQYVNAKDNILDIGCGKGGDVTKFQRQGITKYTGIDNSKNSLEVCHQRISKTNMKYDLILDTIYSQNGFGENYYDIVSAQFSFHYGFENVEYANQSIANVYKCLKKNGYFIGTIPISETSYEKVKASIVGYNDVFFEPSVSISEFKTKMMEHGFKPILLQGFLDYYKKKSIEEEELLKLMKADVCKPCDHYHVFVFLKT